MLIGCNINGTWGSKTKGSLKLSYEGGKPQRGGSSFLRGIKLTIFWIFHFNLLRVIQGIKLK